ncbi:flagellar basal-body MS-ring/collar protein FliF [Denitromonas iodatirespirans]|uniref:Flagellar M-ring protein n=1 Tax=Denitromonas iodatirespirans TaxID=2795389 RepID=A0A944HF15_DENI1|nr:flagellar basal-body MS-ring/collar protein FliF [Denitromonas iodatirespirans]MBT0963341.1 flagellar M-ring protein FliF [Denitromonas iodatirespirans]
MATAQEAAAPGSPIQQVIDNFVAMSARQKLALMAALAAGIALIVGVLLWSKSADYAVLFSNLEERDGGAIVTALQQQNVPYKFTPGGAAIMVPSERVHDIRLQLAAQGLPRGGMVGFELMENQKLGVSQFHEQVNYQRALEGELARTIQAIGSVANARVHLAIPKRSAFLRDQQKPTASVFVNMRAGRDLNGAQVAGIVHLVSSSVPNMDNGSVSVIDETGKLLTNTNDPLRAAGLDPTQLRYVDELESTYVRRIETILEPMVGKGNFRAQVTADVDFNRVEQTDEIYKPNPSPQQAIRSQQTSEVLTRDPGAQGVPGALSNQPPVPATAPITTPEANGAATGADGNVLTRNTNATTNYEVDRSIQHTKRAMGTIRRLSVAVVINHRTVTDKNGKETTEALSDEEIARINNLVREAMGFNAERGDSLNVANSAFAAGATEALPDLPLWKDPEMIDLGKQALRYLLVIAVLAYVAFGVIKPLMKTLAPKPAGEEAGGAAAAGEGETGYDEEGAEVSLSSGARQASSYEAKLARARETAKDNPKLVANLIKEWLGANEEGRK